MSAAPTQKPGMFDLSGIRERSRRRMWRELLRELHQAQRTIAYLEAQLAQAGRESAALRELGAKQADQLRKTTAELDAAHAELALHRGTDPQAVAARRALDTVGGHQ